MLLKIEIYMISGSGNVNVQVPYVAELYWQISSAIFTTCGLCLSLERVYALVRA